MNWSALDVQILGPAFVAGLLVVATHVPLGQEVLRRGIIFIDLAIAQIAGLGVIIAHTLGMAESGWALQLSAAGAALLAAAGLNWSEKRLPQVQEALIGTLFVLAATAGILFLSGNPHGGEYLKDLLVGQILWVRPEVLWPIALLYAAVLALWFAFGMRHGRWLFYVLFAIAVTASVQLVGIYLVFATLIIPALATRALAGKCRLIAAWTIGAGGYLAGLALSALFDLPSGAVVVWTLAVLALVAQIPVHRFTR
ncbi:MAG: metal ABC transporter permease [Wenzhouxiangellaceae bacterium]|nr:metal ABC transporter permease [Wenzhouxiangellaceae bacterium]